MANVKFPTDGLFLTLGKMMPPFRDAGLLALALTVLVGIVFDCTVFCVLLDGDGFWFDVCDVGEATEPVVVVGTGGGSVNSSINEYLCWTQREKIWKQIQIITTSKKKTHKLL